MLVFLAPGLMNCTAVEMGFRTFNVLQIKKEKNHSSAIKSIVLLNFTMLSYCAVILSLLIRTITMQIANQLRICVFLF